MYRRNYTCNLCTATLDSVRDMISATTDDEGCKILSEAKRAATVQSVLPAHTTQEVVGQNLEGNPSQRAQPQQNSACWRFLDSKSFCNGLFFVAGVIVIVIWVILMLDWVIMFNVSRKTSNQD